MIIKSKLSDWKVSTLLCMIACTIMLSCSDEEDPILPPSLSYQESSFDVGEAGEVIPVTQGDAATYEITNANGTEDFVSINANNGILSVGTASVKGEYNVVVKASNNAGDDEATAKITIKPLPPTVTYDNVTVDLGGEFEITPTTAGDTPMTFAIEDAGGTAEFVSIDENTGVLSVGKGSTIGNYTVHIKVTNSAGSINTTAVIAISIPDDFNPVGKTLEWKFIVNQSENIKLVGLNGVPEMEISELVLPIGWPTSSTPAENVSDHFVLSEVQSLMLQQPGNIFCFKGNTLKFSVDENLNLHAICSEGDPILIGYSNISYKNDQFVYSLDLLFNDSGTLRIKYDIEGATFASFSDSWTDPANPKEYTALQGNVKEYVTPSDWSTSESISDVNKLITTVADVVLEVIE